VILEAIVFLLLAGAALFFGWVVLVGLTQRRFVVRGFVYAQNESPAFFWATAITISGVAIGFLLAAILVALEAFGHL
jgi:hypothetical protein